MKIKIISMVCVFYALSIIGWPGTSYAQDCSRLMQYGLYDIKTGNQTVNSTDELSSYFMDHRFESVEDMRRSASSFGLSIPVKALQFGMNSSSGSARSRARAVQSYLQQDSEARSEFSNSIQTLSQTISSEVTNLVNTCIENQSGLKVWIEEGSDPTQFKVLARHVANSNPTPHATIRNFSIVPNKSVEIDPGGAKLFKSGATVGASTQEVIVTRLDSTSVTVSLNTDVNRTWLSDAELPKIDDDDDWKAVVGDLLSHVDKLEEEVASLKARPVVGKSYQVFDGMTPGSACPPGYGTEDVARFRSVDEERGSTLRFCVINW